MQPTQEFVNGQAVTRRFRSFRVYHSMAQSIEDHGRLLATGGPYRQSMTLIHDPNAFASSLTGVYATDPGYGAKLISLMHRFDLYRYDAAAHAAPTAASSPGANTAKHCPARGQRRQPTSPGPRHRGDTTAAPGYPHAAARLAHAYPIDAVLAPSQRPRHRPHRRRPRRPASTAPASPPSTSPAPGSPAPTGAPPPVPAASAPRRGAPERRPTRRR